MEPTTLRGIVAIVLAVVLLRLSRHLSDRPHRRRGYTLGAAALCCLGVINVVPTPILGIDWLATAIGVVGIALLALAAWSIAMAYRSGELRGTSALAAAEARQYREQRDAERRK